MGGQRAERAKDGDTDGGPGSDAGRRGASQWGRHRRGLLERPIDRHDWRTSYRASADHQHRLTQVESDPTRFRPLIDYGEYLHSPCR
jgi:hypothetical protein